MNYKLGERGGWGEAKGLTAMKCWPKQNTTTMI